ncbi:CrcB family protein [Stomatohabitans albus]|uniref:fluoride efflux transporter FluC n=1 Tax=Stomatohabitans albus TaxID=3110766 RepID=UPI00300D08B9
MDITARIQFPAATMGWVALGGGLGSALRWALSDLFAFPVGIWAVNLLGSFCLGLLIAWTAARAQHPSWVLPALGSGFCGGFTTFSTAIFILVDQAVTHQILAFLIVMIVMPMGCALGALAGHYSVRILPKAIQ